MTVLEAKNSFSKALENHSKTPRLDVDCFLQKILNCTKTNLLMKNRDELSDAQKVILEGFIAERKKGMPVAYIIHEKEFFGYKFFVTPDVLIPKPDTEILVEEAVRILKEKILSSEKKLSVLDMCTGSGCIAISVFRSLIDDEKIPLSKMPFFVLADISEPALKIAEKNSELLLTDEERKNISFVKTDLFEKISGRFDGLLTNPPYIPKHLVEELLLDGRNEPRLALDGDNENTNDGLYIISRIFFEMKNFFESNSFLLMETGEYNAQEAKVIAEKSGLQNLSILKDLEGQNRVVKGFVK